MTDQRPDAAGREGLDRGTGGRPATDGGRAVEDVPVESGTVRTNGVETYYERRGEGPTVVFVHAALMDHSMWTPQLDALGEGYTTVVYDIRGHGHTGGSPVETYSVELFAEDLAALLAALDVDRPVLCGHSLGGAVAQVYAARHPDELAGLVLAETWTAARLGWRDRLLHGFLNAHVPLVRLLGLARVQRAGVWLQERFDPAAGGDYGTIEQLQAEMPPIPFGEFEKVVHSITSFPGTSVDLGSIPVPTLVMYGENTTGYVRRHALRLAAAVPDATVEVVPDGGHACNLDNPEVYSARLHEFVDRVTGNGW